jgi:hypothetical protein
VPRLAPRNGIPHIERGKGLANTRRPVECRRVALVQEALDDVVRAPLERDLIVELEPARIGPDGLRLRWGCDYWRRHARAGQIVEILRRARPRQQRFLARVRQHLSCLLPGLAIRARPVQDPAALVGELHLAEAAETERRDSAIDLRYATGIDANGVITRAPFIRSGAFSLVGHFPSASPPGSEVERRVAASIYVSRSAGW